MGLEPTYRHPIALTRPLRLRSANYNRRPAITALADASLFFAPGTPAVVLSSDRCLAQPSQYASGTRNWQNGQSVAEALDDVARFVDKVEPLVSSE